MTLTIMAVFAHPDDETFICGGTLAKFAQAGERVVLLCATRGEMGRRMGVPPVATRETLPQLRDKELQEACRALGIAELKYLGLRDKTLEIQPFEPLVATILEHLRKETPNRVVTFHERLGGHADHCTIGRAATRAFSMYQKEHPEANLFFVAWNTLATEPERYGLDSQDLLRVDVRPQLAAKLLAFRAHRSQSGMNPWLWHNDRQSQQKLAPDEFFIRYQRSSTL